MSDELKLDELLCLQCLLAGYEEVIHLMLERSTLWVARDVLLLWFGAMNKRPGMLLELT